MEMEWLTQNSEPQKSSMVAGVDENNYRSSFAI